MSTLNLKPTHKPVREYFAELKTLARLDLYAEGQVSPAFAALLRYCGRQFGWTLAEQYPLQRKGHSLRLDGALGGRHPAKGVRPLALGQGRHILDPFVGAGNFIINIMRQMKKTALPHKFSHELHCNEVNSGNYLDQINLLLHRFDLFYIVKRTITNINHNCFLQ